MKNILITGALATAAFMTGQVSPVVAPAAVTEPVKKTPPGEVPEMKINLNPNGDRWIKLGLNSQVMFRAIENNPGTRVNNVPEDQTLDAGIRRMRITLQTELSPYYSIYLQAGINNQSFISGGGTGTGANGQGKKPGLFFHDAYNEFAVVPRKNVQTGEAQPYNLYMGGGLHSWNGVSRLTNASTTRMLAYDIPVYNFPGIEVSDQFSRQFGLFMHGDVQRLSYRFSLNKPFATNLTPVVGGGAVDNNAGGKLSAAGYVYYQFLDRETSVLPFLTGNYQGSRRMLNIGGGFYHNKNGTQSQPKAGTFEQHDINIAGADVYAEMPLGEKVRGMGLTFYSVFYHYDYGPNYLRTSGIMNPGTPDSDFTGIRPLEGPGNNRVLMGTGNIWYTQAGLMLPKFSDWVRIQPYATYALKDMRALNQAGHFFDFGANFFIHGTNSRLAFNYGIRPLYNPITREVMDHRGEAVLLMQIVL